MKEKNHCCFRRFLLVICLTVLVITICMPTGYADSGNVMKSYDVICGTSGDIQKSNLSFESHMSDYEMRYAATVKAGEGHNNRPALWQFDRFAYYSHIVSDPDGTTRFAYETGCRHDSGSFMIDGSGEKAFAVDDPSESVLDGIQTVCYAVCFEEDGDFTVCFSSQMMGAVYD